MAHIILPGPQPNIVVMDLIGELTWEDMTADEALGLNGNQPMYVVLDASKISVNVPENFLDGAKKSYFTHPNMAHLALYVKSDLLRNIAIMVAKVTRRRERISLHNGREGAIAHLQTLAQASRR